ncbi:MAG: outer membrane protein assembly factor BamD [Bacteroidaceae bacterium]|nr:outer membrane protein assembly factor BamD [Prevotellaceae bacterium]MDY5631631.1 outer membrane protein assembly factor BamD [Bacteroidaceae bacterium]
MQKTLLILTLALMLSSCGEYQALLKSSDYEYRYEAAKAYYAEGKYTKASLLFGDLLAILKGTAWGEECLFLLSMSEFQAGNYETAASYFKKYYQSYPKGSFAEQAHYYGGRSLYMQTPDPRLDQTSTIEAMGELQAFMDRYPFSPLKPASQEMVMQLQDKMVEKECLAAQLYYNLGSYMMNCAYGGSNYQACVVTAQNALNEYPYAAPEKRERLSYLILLSKYHLAQESVEAKRIERFRDAIDEYYAFENDFPESKYMKEAREMLQKSQKAVGNKTEN